MQLSFEFSTANIEVKESIYPHSAAICVDSQPKIFLTKEQARDLTMKLIANDQEYWVDLLSSAIIGGFKNSEELE